MIKENMWMGDELVWNGVRKEIRKECGQNIQKQEAKIVYNNNSDGENWKAKESWFIKYQIFSKNIQKVVAKYEY